MPLIELFVSVSAPENVETVQKEIADMMAKAIGKPVDFVMVRIAFDESISFGGTMAPAALVKLGSIGKISADENKKYSEVLCNFLESSFQISPERTYIQITDYERQNWGWNGSTFG
eukprot:m.96769 g.96769  ORF g.96769 m.96769 type:complete len:116 (-) comp8973_c1_seq1:85-432(-)